MPGLIEACRRPSTARTTKCRSAAVRKPVCKIIWGSVSSNLRVRYPCAGRAVEAAEPPDKARTPGSLGALPSPVGRHRPRPHAAMPWGRRPTVTSRACDHRQGLAPDDDARYSRQQPPRRSPWRTIPVRARTSSSLGPAVRRRRTGRARRQLLGGRLTRCTHPPSQDPQGLLGRALSRPTASCVRRSDNASSARYSISRFC